MSHKAIGLAPKRATEQDFLAVFSRLCVALREAQDESGITQQVYWEALKDLPLKALELGAGNLMREKGRRFFPSTTEWRAAAYEAEVTTRNADLGRTEPWHDECRDCEDTGWVLGLECDGGPTCGRKQKHLAHSYTIPCPCRATNRTYLRRQALGYGAA
jgi:hypothetical protein